MADTDFIVADQVTDALRRARAFGDDMTATMGEIARMLAAGIRINFLNQSSPLGVPWKQSQRAKDEGGQTLIDSTDLFNSIKESWGPDFASAGPEASGAAAIYAKIHQWGGKITPKVGKALRTPFGLRAAVNMPARPYAGWNDQLERDTIEILGDHARAAVIGGAFSG